MFLAITLVISIAAAMVLAFAAIIGMMIWEPGRRR